MKNFKFRVYLSWYDADKYLDVLVAPEGKQWEGPAVHTVRKDNVSIGVAENDIALYVRIKEAQSIDRTFQSIARRIAKREAPTALQLDYLLKRASKMMREVVDGESLDFKKSNMGSINYTYA